ncbi:MAG TPA: NAD-dependent epimerase/dehydratase family protein [Longimicrobiales bacterium]|nr:NAD-dependent epimerase/dehydratase family protein [Longimicrobiales bacterium]
MIYVTGATGFIGSRVARRFLERGEKVRCLVRNAARATELQRLGAELVTGDLADEATHLRAIDGARAAIHLAAIYDLGLVDRGALERTNVDGTRAFLNAAEKSGIDRTIYISTTVALGPVVSQPTEPVEAYDGPYHSVYHETKSEAHRLARAKQRAGVPLIIVCPSFVYGPGDDGPGGRFIRDIAGRKLPALLSAPSSFAYVYVDDVADGIIAALDRGVPGETYLLTGPFATMNEFAQSVARTAGVKAPRMRMPVGVARALGAMLDPVARLTGIRFPITAEGIRTTAIDRWLHTHERAKRDLGYAPRSLDSGLRETVG